MATATQPFFKRDVLGEKESAQTTEILQQNLVNLVDLALLLKQAHWNVIGPNFRSVHLQLDEIIESVRSASDEVAERMDTLGVAPDGRANTVAQQSILADYPRDFQKVPDTIERVADALKSTIDALRTGIASLGELDPISEDMFIGISAGLEKHLWMVQAQQA